VTLRRRAVFLDRDGTLCEEVGYLNHLSRFRLFPYAVDAVRLINQSGLLAIVVTNQAGVARGYFPESFVAEVHAQLESRMADGGARLDALYYCPHHPLGAQPAYRQDCTCRKPRPGLLQRAAAEHTIDLERSYVIGDRYHDVELAWTVGARGALVRTGQGAGELLHKSSGWKRPPDILAENLLDATTRILHEASA
jgi:D-glycero-D-manno-heptose 1,7-bisphosphate phosphatase